MCVDIRLCVCIYVCMCVYVSACGNTSLCMHVRVCVCVCVCLCVGAVLTSDSKEQCSPTEPMVMFTRNDFCTPGQTSVSSSSSSDLRLRRETNHPDSSDTILRDCA